MATTPNLYSWLRRLCHLNLLSQDRTLVETAVLGNSPMEILAVVCGQLAFQEHCSVDFQKFMVDLISIVRITDNRWLTTAQGRTGASGCMKHLALLIRPGRQRLRAITPLSGVPSPTRRRWPPLICRGYRPRPLWMSETTEGTLFSLWAPTYDKV